ncbi:hypothetical protein OIU79_012666 [Salix purpurea]|uniref:Ubiquitin-like domain-containing protein n=1 Tax=Salix purpurea TaxID=77065 RepID=A0A9Q0T2Z3_SALPP|nr:hypothetical protein OIU79_012666 [Salix purpurea]
MVISVTKHTIKKKICNTIQYGIVMAPAIVKCKIVGGKVALDFEISACSTVRDLKENISGKTKLDMDRRTLTCCGEEMELENLRSLESYGYAEEAVIRLDASPLPDDSRFSILVKSANHPYATISVMEKETVADLKANISRLLPIPACTMTLMYDYLWKMIIFA